MEQKNGNFKFINFNDHILGKKIFAGSDFLISTLKHDPCDMSLLIGMKYGAVPVAYFSSNVKDIVIDIDDTEPNGFIFKEHSKDGLIKAVNKAISYYKDREKWLKIVKNSMNFDSTIIQNIKEYINLYNEKERQKERKLCQEQK